MIFSIEREEHRIRGYSDATFFLIWALFYFHVRGWGIDFPHSLHSFFKAEAI